MSETIDAGSPVTSWDEWFGTRCNVTGRQVWLNGTGSASYSNGRAWGFPSWAARARALDRANDAVRQAVDAWVRQNCPGFCPPGCECKYDLAVYPYPSHRYTSTWYGIGWGGTWTWDLWAVVTLECWKA